MSHLNFDFQTPSPHPRASGTLGTLILKGPQILVRFVPKSIATDTVSKSMYSMYACETRCCSLDFHNSAPQKTSRQHKTKNVVRQQATSMCRRSHWENPKRHRDRSRPGNASAGTTRTRAHAHAHAHAHARAPNDENFFGEGAAPPPWRWCAASSLSAEKRSRSALAFEWQQVSEVSSPMQYELRYL